MNRQKTINDCSRYKKWVILLLIVFAFPSVTKSYGEIIEITPIAGMKGCEVSESCYSKTGIIIKKGEIITWKNNSIEIHHIVSGSPQWERNNKFSGLILPDESFSHRFTELGQFFYYCNLHPWMTGVVMVS